MYNGDDGGGNGADSGDDHGVMMGGDDGDDDGDDDSDNGASPLSKTFRTYVGHPSPVKEENKVSMAWGSESKLKTRFFHSRSVTYKTNERSEYLKTFCIKVRECERVSWG